MKRKCLLFLTMIAVLLNAAVVSAECQIQLSEPLVKYDPVTRGELVSRPGNSLSGGELRVGDERVLELMVNCDRPTSLTLQFIGPEKDGESYRFGALGRASIVLHDVMIDERQVQIASAGKRAPAMAFTAAQVLNFWKDGHPVSGSSLRAKVSITPLMPSEGTRVGERQIWQLDGRFVVGGVT